MNVFSMKALSQKCYLISLNLFLLFLASPNELLPCARRKSGNFKLLVSFLLQKSEF